MIASTAQLTVVDPGAGPSEWTGPLFGIIHKLDAEQTGSISIVEHPFGPGALVPPHIHTREDEISYVIEGEIGFRSSDRELTLAAGGYIVKPRGELHAMWNAGPAPARMIEIITPAGFERYFVELAEVIASAGDSAPDPAAIQRVGARYGLTFDFGWVPDLVARYGLTPPRR